MGIVLLTSLIIFISDFITKAALKPFVLQSFPVIKNVFHITVIFNRGAAFGIFSRHTSLLILISIIFLAVLWNIIKKESGISRLLNIAYGLILGGAASNLLDRLVYGYVIDYLDFRIWPVFNIADAGISTGVFLVILYSLTNHYREKNISHSGRA